MKEKIHTGFEMIDKDFGGLKSKEITLIGGRPAMGKTTIALQIALNVARTGKNVLYVSAECGLDEMNLRLASIVSGISGAKIRSWDMTDAEWELFRKAVEEIKKLPISFYHTDSMQMIKYRCDDETKPQIDLVICDPVQLFKCTDTVYKDLKTSPAPRKSLKALKKLAKSHNVSVVVLSQLSRKLEKRKDKHPKMKDLKVKGLSDKLFDQAFLLYRDGYYDLNAPSEKAELTGVCPKRNLKETKAIRWNSDRIIFE